MLRLRRGQNRFNALADDVQPTVLDEPEGDTEVIDALEFDLTRENEQSPHVPDVAQDHEEASQTQNWKAEIQVSWFREGLSCLWIELTWRTH